MTTPYTTAPQQYSTIPVVQAYAVPTPPNDYGSLNYNYNYSNINKHPPIYNHNDDQSIYYDVENQDKLNEDDEGYSSAEEIEEMSTLARQLFIARVYGILCLQLFITFAVCTVFSTVPSFRDFALSAGWPLLICSSIITFISLIMLLCCFATSFPINFILLLAFTLGEATSLGVLCAMYTHLGLGVLLMQAASITCLTFLTLTLCTLSLPANTDLGCMGMTLSICLPLLVVWGLFNSVFASFGVNTSFSSFLYAAISAIVFSCFVVYDTWLLQTRLKADQYILASVTLYLDVLNLFLDILRLLQGSDGGRGESN